MSEEELRAFNEAETRGCLMVRGIEVAPEFTEDRDAITAVRALCWSCGEYFINDDGVKVRVPMPKEECTC